ncbi:putative RRM domain and KH domain (SPAC30D11.14-like KH) protein [Gregarina niphandrodes]|uniref:RRM domain and KH domain (SPAC30D11.14-like KH) protein n=1 Tax=Gregarina niphandrodes TaxID=110365 RepID=A0A023B497_GRENI|nr:putative RRM domain and KH domain (SPAC30D11.14-like KH) protein [Gregarina niphandrodes]EZG56478.1 putative RRM domain and KH domain (SPAC30D11.14-like KH) protein [Gregarina niphandrodes]|eukprot:XP_011131253.1 putative RRM domain and KH domain (SPAC30D11.14-like KH) protein [Gregarina niphandrodes]
MANRVVSPSRGGKQTDSAAARSRRGAEPIRKWTVRYEIQIPANNDFQITRRIIGVRGNNMKSVNQATGAKLRLRGRGSGYLEGLGKEEANEPLHLCISCTDEAGYRNARQRTELLLKTVYDEFDQWCLERGIKPPRLAIKAKELLCMHSPV